MFRSCLQETGIFGTHANIYGGAFLREKLTAKSQQLFLHCVILFYSIFMLLPDNTTPYNFSKEELAMRGLAEDHSIVIKPADKGSFIVVWDRTDYLPEVEKHLSGSSTYKEVTFVDKELFKLLEESNTMFTRLMSKKCILPEECNFKKVTNFGKIFFA